MARKNSLSRSRNPASGRFERVSSLARSRNPASGTHPASQTRMRPGGSSPRAGKSPTQAALFKAGLKSQDFVAGESFSTGTGRKRKTFTIVRTFGDGSLVARSGRKIITVGKGRRLPPVRLANSRKFTV